MNKIAKIVAAVAIAVVPFVASSGALAMGSCQVGYTGPNSNNECTLESTYTCSVTNDNDFDIINENGQVAGSGSATSGDSTSSGSATSGSATNENGTSINVSITNGDSSKVCTVVTTVPATPEQPTPSTPEQPTPSTPPVVQPMEAPTPGRGAATPVVKETVQAPQKAAPAVLPYTSGNNLMSSLIAVTGLLAIGLIVSRLAVAAYSRHMS